MYLFSVLLFTLVWFSFKLATSLNKRTLDGKILGGKNASILDHAHAVLLQITKKKDSSSHICGASILNQKILLTAAHCFTIDGNFKTIAFAGHEDIRKSLASRTALKTMLHEHFKNAKSVKNDIALIVLIKELPLGAKMKRVIIRSSFPRDVTGTLAGWGLIDEATLKGTELLKLVNQKVRIKECEVIHLKKGMFCAGSMKSSNPAPSFGDSGSGLVTKNYQIIGILSYKIHEFPALPAYTNVSYFYPWIKNLSRHIYCSK